MNAEISFNGHKWEIKVVELNRAFIRDTIQAAWNFCREFELDFTIVGE